MVWLPDDFGSVRIHPSPAGEAKVAGLLSSFFDAAPSARLWWPAVRTDATLVAVDAAKDAHVDAAQPSSNFGSAPLLVERGGAAPINVHLAFDVSATPRPYALTKLSARVGQGGGGRVSGVADTAWGEGSITWANAPAIGAALVEMPQSTRDGTIAASVGGAVNGDPDGRVGFALTTTASTVLAYPSRESGQPPRLVATVPCVNAADGDGDGITDLCDCAPADPSVFAPPSEISRLVWLDASTLGWDLDPSGPGTRYDVPTLIHLKLRKGGPQDVLDVAMLLQQHPAEVARARELATAYGLAAQLESFMESPRIKATPSGTVGRRARRARKS